MVVGFSAPVFISIAYYAFKGAFTPYVRSALMQNIGYLSSWQGGSGGLINRLVILAGLTIAIFVFRKKVSDKIAFFLYWFIFSLFGALLSGRPYPHYLIEVAPSLTIIPVLVLEKLTNREKNKNTLDWLFSFVAVSLGVIAYFYYQFWWYPQVSYYKNFASYIFGGKTTQQYTQYWGERALENKKLAQYIKQTTFADQNIFVWGEASCTYALSNRLPPGRYVVNYHISDFNGYEETLKAIKEKNPKLIIKLKEETSHWPELDLLLEKNYSPLTSLELEDKIYLLNEANLD